MTQFKQTNLMQSFLQSTLITIICFLMILTGMLLYSLMLSDVDSKTYEYGMLRALGFKSSHLIGMITIQSFIFSVPGVALGLIVSGIKRRKFWSQHRFSLVGNWIRIDHAPFVNTHTNQVSTWKKSQTKS